MSKAKHTPGPWVYAPDFDSDGKRAKVTTVAQCCEFVIGLPPAYEGGNFRDGDPSGEAEADARLMAAAPDMLGALKWAREFIRNGVELGFIRMPDADCPDPAHKTLPAIEAAIAKATGEAAHA